MRNLKKILALVLALMMTVSVMMFASAAGAEDYNDADQINAQYVEAVDVLTGMGVFQGYGDGFQPTANVRRSEVAALVYRSLTADVADEQTHIWEESNYFDDVNTNSSLWAAGYIGYSAHYGFVIGNGQGQFMPEDYVTGYQLLVIMLRALGYGENNEFVGAQWELNVARIASERGILDGFTTSRLSDYLTREEVAYLLFNAIRVNKVSYTPAFGYQIGEFSIGEQMFKLDSDVNTADNYGRPSTTWFSNNSWTVNMGNNTVTTDTTAYEELTDTAYAVIEDTPVAVYYTAETLCDVAAAVNEGNDFTSNSVWTNGAESTTAFTVNATNTVTTMGKQGQATEIYKDGTEWVIVYVDTYLGEVTAVSPAVVDTAGHEVRPAQLTLNTGTLASSISGIVGEGYAVGDYVLFTQYGGTAAPTSTQIDIVGAAPTVDVTISGLHITMNAYDGVIANSTTYLNNNTFGTSPLTMTLAPTTHINRNYRLYLDNQGNLMGLDGIGLIESVGVVTAAELVSAGTGRYVMQVDLFLADGTTVTRQFVNGNTGTTSDFFPVGGSASWAAAGTFVRFETVSINGSTYYTISDTAKDVVLPYGTSATGFTTASADRDSYAETGIANTLDTTVLLNDATRFIVANYVYDYSINQTVLQGYSVYTGFKTIPTLTGTTYYGSLTDTEGTQYVLLTSALTGAAVQSAKPAYQVDTSALFLSKGQTYQYYSTYNVVLNGQKTTVNVSNNVESVINTNGMNRVYALSGLNTSGYYTGLALPVDGAGNQMGYLAAGGTATYADGVLTYVNGTATTYLTVADNCTVQVVNYATEEVYAATLDNLSQYSAQAISYELDANGYVSYLYLTDVDA